MEAKNRVWDRLLTVPGAGSIQGLSTSFSKGDVAEDARRLFNYFADRYCSFIDP